MTFGLKYFLINNFLRDGVFQNIFFYQQTLDLKEDKCNEQIIACKSKWLFEFQLHEAALPQKTVLI